jgi:hypothetical protein
MAKWTFWEWVAYAVLFLAAIIIAADEGVKLAPDLLPAMKGILGSPWWAFSPLALILFATAILVGREMDWIGKKPAAVTIPSIEPAGQFASDYSDDPEAEATDKQAYKEILDFALDQVIPACETQVELQNAILSQATSDPVIDNLAILGLRNSEKTKEFWNHYEALSAGLLASPGPLIRFEAIIEHIAALENENYRVFTEQMNQFAIIFSLNVRTNANLRPVWIKWVEAHNALIEAYEAIKRDPRFGRLLRPARPSRWGDRIQLDHPRDRGQSAETGVSSEQTIDIRFEPQPPYQISEISNGRGLSTIRIGLKAVGKIFANCKIYVEKIAPQPSLPGGLPILLSGDAPMLRPDDPEVLIDIAAHWDHVAKYRFSAPLPWHNVQLTYIDDEPPRLIEIKITARTDAGEFIKTATFKIWVDDAKKIHLQRQ